MNKKLMITNGGYRNAGLFSYVGQVIGNLHVSDKNGVDMWVNLPHSPYLEQDRGLNCWDYYFKQPYDVDDSKLKNYDEIDEKEWFDGRIDTITPNFTNETLVRARELCKKYIKPVPLIANKIEEFKKNVIGTEKYAAIHFRGTDHHYGAPNDTFPIIPMSVYFDCISQLLTKFEKVLVCSDQQNFIDTSIEKFGKDKISAYDSMRSNSHLAVHYNNDGIKYKSGEDVVIESFLMSESKYLIRTCSGVTHFSIFNNQDPEFKYVNMDEQYYGRKH
jgi:hypothetical protein